MSLNVFAGTQQASPAVGGILAALGSQYSQPQAGISGQYVDQHNGVCMQSLAGYE